MIELILMLPFFYLLFWGFHWLFHLGIHQQKNLIRSTYQAKEILQRR